MPLAGLVALQKAVFDTLSADAAVKALVGPTTARVYDEPPTGPEYPFILIPEIRGEAEDTNSERGWNATVQVHAFSTEQRGGKEAKDICHAVRYALDRKESSLTLESGSVYLCEYLSTSDPVLLESGVGWRQTVSFKVLMNE
jgi:hypothetical protein